MKISVPISALIRGKNPAVWSVAPETTVFEAIKLMAAKNVGALLVISGGLLVGIFTERDYTRKIALMGKTSRETKVRDIFSSAVITVAPDDSIEDCMKLMTEHRVRHLPVVENENVLGIISIGDLVNWIISAQNATIDQMEQYIAGGYPG
jgi:CBS domain-containing protein